MRVRKIKRVIFVVFGLVFFVQAITDSENASLNLLWSLSCIMQLRLEVTNDRIDNLFEIEKLKMKFIEEVIERKEN